MLKVNATQWLRYRTQFKIPRSLESKPTPSKLFKAAAVPAIPVKTVGRSIGTQTEAIQSRMDMPSNDLPPPPQQQQGQNTNAPAAVTAAFQDLLGVSNPNTPTDDLKNTFYQRELPTTLIRFASPEGKKLFREAMDDGHAEGFFPLTGNFTTQSEPAYCGPSSCKYEFKLD